MPPLRKTLHPRPSLIALFMLLGLTLSVSAQRVSSGEGGAVNLSLSVIDKNKLAVSTLRKEDLRVLENEMPQEISDFKRQNDQSLSVMVVLDISISQERVIPLVKQVSREFVDSVIRPGKDNVGVITFTDEAKLEQELTGEMQRVHLAIEGVEFTPPAGYIGSGTITSKPPKPGADQLTQGSTAIWDTIRFASDKFGAQSSGDDRRRVVILITDGNDTSSSHKLMEAVEVAIKSGVVVYSIGIGDEDYGGTNDGNLRKISERTGGRAFFPKKVKDLRAAFAEIEQGLHSQYLISFKPSGNKADDKIRKIKIEIVNPELRKQGLQLSYQQSHYARSN